VLLFLKLRLCGHAFPAQGSEDGQKASVFVAVGLDQFDRLVGIL
jgi:hypothetical protein